MGQVRTKKGLGAFMCWTNLVGQTLVPLFWPPTYLHGLWYKTENYDII